MISPEFDLYDVSRFSQRFRKNVCLPFPILGLSDIKNCMIAGGFVASLVDSKVNKNFTINSDIDIFVYGSLEERKTAVNEILKVVRDKNLGYIYGSYSKGKSPVITIFSRNMLEPIQIIVTTKNSREDILSEFDLSVSQCLIERIQEENSNNYKFRVLGTRIFVQSFLNGRIQSNRSLIKGLPTVQRLVKYHLRHDLKLPRHFPFNKEHEIAKFKNKNQVCHHKIVSNSLEENLKYLKLHNPKIVVFTPCYYENGEITHYFVEHYIDFENGLNLYTEDRKALEENESESETEETQNEVIQTPKQEDSDSDVEEMDVSGVGDEIQNSWIDIQPKSKEQNIDENKKRELSMKLFNYDILIEETKELLDQGVDPNIKDCYGRTPIYYISSVEITKLLVEAGADPNVKDNQGNTPIHLSSIPEKIKMLLENGADPNLKNNEGQTPEQHQKLIGNVVRAEVIKSFIKNKKRELSMRLFNQVNTVEEIKNILKQGADPNVRGLDNQTPLHRTYNLEKVKLLVEAGADINTRNNEGNTPFHKSGNPEKIKFLLEAGADPTLKNRKNQTPEECHRLEGRPDCASVIKSFIKNKEIEENENGVEEEKENSEKSLPSEEEIRKVVESVIKSLNIKF